MKKYIGLLAAASVSFVFLLSTAPVKAQAENVSNCTAYGNNIHCTDSSGHSWDSYCWGTAHSIHCRTTDTTQGASDGGYAIGYALGSGIGAAVERHRRSKAQKSYAEFCLQNTAYSWPSGTTCTQYLALFPSSVIAKYTKELKKQGKLK